MKSVSWYKMRFTNNASFCCTFVTSKIAVCRQGELRWHENVFEVFTVTSSKYGIIRKSFFIRLLVCRTFSLSSENHLAIGGFQGWCVMMKGVLVHDCLCLYERALLLGISSTFLLASCIMFFLCPRWKKPTLHFVTSFTKNHYHLIM